MIIVFIGCLCSAALSLKAHVNVNENELFKITDFFTILKPSSNTQTRVIIKPSLNFPIMSEEDIFNQFKFSNWKMLLLMEIKYISCILIVKILEILI